MKKAAKVKYVEKIKDKGYPVSSKHYAESHEKANKAEKKQNPKMYAKEEKAERSLKKGTLMATHNKKGKIKIEKKYKEFTPTLKTHEFTEWKEDKRLCALCHKPKSAHK